MKRRFIWTPDRVSLLVRKYPTALSLTTLAEELGCNVMALYNKAHLLRIRRHKNEERYLHHMVKLPPKVTSTKYSDQQIETVVKNYATISNSTLSLVTGVRVKTIKKWARKLGLRKRHSIEASKESIARSRKKYRAKNREKVHEARRRWRERNRDKERNVVYHVRTATVVEFFDADSFIPLNEEALTYRFSYRNKYGEEPFICALHYSATLTDRDEILEVMKRAARWFNEYNRFKDTQIELGGIAEMS